MSGEIKTYLGDSVYAYCDGFRIRLTTENGYGPSNEIIVEPEVLENLNRFFKRTTQPKETKEDGQ